MESEKTVKNNRELLNISVKEFIEDYAYRIDLDADYQREKIWSSKQQQELLDSILREIDIPKIYIVKVGTSCTTTPRTSSDHWRKSP